VDERLYLDHHLVPGVWVPNGCMATTGSLVRWFQREIAAGAPLEALDAEAADAGPGAGGLVLTPYFLGEKTPLNDPLARGIVVGLHLGHRRGHLFRAVLEGVAFAFRHHVDVLRELGVRAQRVSLTGGCASSALWRQIIADVLALPVVRRDNRSGAALGAAFAAGMGAGVLGSWSDITRLAGAGETTAPDPRTVGSGFKCWRPHALTPARASAAGQAPMGQSGQPAGYPLACTWKVTRPILVHFKWPAFRQAVAVYLQLGRSSTLNVCPRPPAVHPLSLPLLWLTPHTVSSKCPKKP
jgi:hypothetical protein